MAPRITVQLLVPILALCGVLLCLVQLDRFRDRGADPAANESAPPTIRSNPALVIQSPMAERLGAAERTALDDLKALHEMLGYFSHDRESSSPPLGTNREITAALSKPNHYGQVYLHPRHPAINERGELTDRWGVPFFIHPLSRDSFELRSAGPDRRLFTEDDLYWPEQAPGYSTRSRAEVSVSIR